MEEPTGGFRAQDTWLGCNGVISLALLLAALVMYALAFARRRQAERPAE